MKGQLLFRKANAKTKSGKDVYVVLGLVTLEGEIIKDGFKYDVLDIAVYKGEDFSELNNSMSPEELLEAKIWKIK